MSTHERPTVAAARAAYDEDCRRRPVYHDGAPRPSWDALSDLVRSTWERNPTPREYPPTPCAHPRIFTDNAGSSCPTCGWSNAFPWTCSAPSCGQLNAGWAAHCGRCERPRPGVMP